MYKRVSLIPYKMGSASCRALSRELKRSVTCYRYRPERHRLRYKDLVIKWGDPTSIASNKLRFFQEAAKEPGLNIPEWTTDRNVALEWQQNNIPFLARMTLTSHSGNGIIIFDRNNKNDVPQAPLYVKYIKKTHEYRVHVYNNKVIDIVQKKRRAGFENTDNKIRNHQNGWIYCRQNLEINNNNALIRQALLACSISQLPFGAVDIIYNTHYDTYYVLEVNTAPGLEGTTVTKYAEAIINHMKE